MNIDNLHIFTFSFGNIRDSLRRLTLLPQLAATIVGIIIASHTALEAWLWATFSFAALLLLFAFESIRIPARLVMFATLAAASYSLHHNPEIALGEPLTMAIEIREESSLRRNYRSYAARAYSEGYEPFKIEVRTPRTIEFRRGDSFRVCTPIKPFTKEPTAYSKQMQRLGLQGVAYVTAEQISDFSSHDRPMVQHRIIDMFCSVAPPTQGRAVAMAIGIGYRGEISRDTANAYINCGLSHLLAVSGLHVGMVLIFFIIVCRPLAIFWRGYEMQIVAIIALVWFYVWMCGMQPSAIRAALLYTLLMLSHLRGRGSTGMINRLFLALIILLIARPVLLYDAGLQLSAIAVAAIMLYAVPLTRVMRCRSALLNYLVAMVVVGTIATIATQPLVALTFGKISFVSAFINPIIILMGYASLIGLQATAAMPDSMQEYVAAMTTSIADAMNAIIEWCSTVGVGYTTVEVTTATVVAIYGGGLIVTLFLSGFRRRKEWNIKDI